MFHQLSPHAAPMCIQPSYNMDSLPILHIVQQILMPPESRSSLTTIISWFYYSFIIVTIIIINISCLFRGKCLCLRLTVLFKCYSYQVISQVNCLKVIYYPTRYKHFLYQRLVSIVMRVGKVGKSEIKNSPHGIYFIFLRWFVGQKLICT